MYWPSASRIVPSACFSVQRTVRLSMLLDLPRVERAQRSAAEEAELLVDQPLQRVANVRRPERLAVVELDPVADADRPDGGLLVRGDLLGEPVELELELRVEDDQRLPARHDPRLIGTRDDVLTVDEVLRRPARDADAERTAALRRRGRDGRRRPLALLTRLPPATSTAPPTAARLSSSSRVTPEPPTARSRSVMSLIVPVPS